MTEEIERTAQNHASKTLASDCLCRRRKFVVRFDSTVDLHVFAINLFGDEFFMSIVTKKFN